MSDQEPESKRIIDQLWEHTEPYQPGAWEHFERLRDKRKSKRRAVIYWLNAAAVLIIFGTAILVNQLTPREKTTKSTITANQRKDDKVSGHINHEQLSSSGHRKRVNSSTGADGVGRKKERIAGETRSASHYPKKPQIRVPEHVPASEIAATEKTIKQQSAILYSLQCRPFQIRNVRFRELYIPFWRQESESAARPANPIRFGVNLSQQSNQAASTHPEVNYVVGGALYIPISKKITFITGTSASKQSLNVEKEAVASMPLIGSAQLQRAHYQWFNVEVPLHMEYSLKTFRKGAVTAVGGLSVLSSIGQTSDYLYKTSRTITTFAETEGGPVVVSTQTVEDFSSVKENNKKDSWVFGAAFYLGLGFNYQLKGYGLGIEPFVKYPIGPVTAEKLQLTSLGVQLKLTGLLNKPR